jgi:Transposase IS116/IS110/IS902 family
VRVYCTNDLLDRLHGGLFKIRFAALDTYPSWNGIEDQMIPFAIDMKWCGAALHLALTIHTRHVSFLVRTYDDEILKDLELSLLKTAKHHDANTLYLLHTVPGIGKILRLVLLYDIHDIRRFPSVQDFASYCRLVKGSKESGGKRLGTSGKKIGNAHLKWAFSEAATLFLRHNPQGQKLPARLEKKHDKGKALSILAHTRGRAVYCMLKRKGAFDMHLFLQSSGSRVGEPGASLDTTWRSLKRACSKPSLAAFLNAKARLGRFSLSLMR